MTCGEITSFKSFLLLYFQNSNESLAYLLTGGIGQKQMKILVESQHISFIQYKAEVYGYLRYPELF